MKRPAFQFYPADWRKDMALQSCSVAARGLWVEMLCIAHECEPYGHLTVNGKPMTAAQIGRHTGLTERECAKLVAELEDAGVVSRTAEGVLYSRRMVRDEDLRNRRAEGGKGGAEHGAKGAEHGMKGGRPAQGRGVSEPPIQPPPSSSSSSSSSTSVEESASALSARGAIGLALKAAGLDPLSFNLSDPRVDALIAAGATPEQWAGMAGEALKAGKQSPWAWVLAVLPERLKAGKAIKPAGRHAGFAGKDYRAGVTDDGYIAAQ